MAPKKKKKGGVDPETEEAIQANFVKFKSEYVKQCDELKVAPVETLSRVQFIERIKWLLVLGVDIGPAGAEALANAVKIMDPKLLKVDHLAIMKANTLDAGAYHLAELLRNRYMIEKCELPENDIGWEGANSIGLALKANIHLTSLNMDKNPLGDEGAAALADGLRWNGKLEELSLEYCGIGCYGAGALAIDVVGNGYCKLTNLSLKGNEIEPEGVAAIADGLKLNHTLTSINLSDTGMGDSPISRDAMRHALIRHVTLTSLDLNLNAIGPEGGQMLLEVLTLNTNIVKCGVFERLVMFKDIQELVATNGSKKKKGKKKKKKK